MSRVNAYASIEKRNFQAALIYLLETEYRMVGSRRILKILAEDVEALVEEFYPKTERVQSGHLIWTCTGDEGEKAQPGKRTESYKATTVVLPLIEPAEIQAQLQRCGRGLEPPDIARETSHSLKSVDRYLKDYERVKMLLKQNLAVEEISAIIGRGQSVVKEYITQAQTYHPELFEPDLEI